MTDLSAAARRIVELGSKATPGPWENSRGFVRSTAGGNTYEAPGMTVQTSCQWVAECRDGEAFYNPDGNANYIAAVNPAITPALAADYLRLREVEKAARVFRIVWQSVCGGETKPPVGKGLEDSMACYDLADALHALDQHRKETK